jgi:hypothetical protein
VFPNRPRGSPHLSTRQEGCIVKRCIGLLGGDPRAYGTCSLRCTLATLIYRKSKSLRVVQLFVGIPRSRVPCGTAALRWTRPRRQPSGP